MAVIRRELMYTNYMTTKEMNSFHIKRIRDVTRIVHEKQFMSVVVGAKTT